MSARRWEAAGARNRARSCCGAITRAQQAAAAAAAQDRAAPPRPPPIACSGKYDGPEAPRLAALRLAAAAGVAYVDIELKVAPVFFAGGCCQALAPPPGLGGGAGRALMCSMPRRMLVHAARPATAKAGARLWAGWTVPACLTASAPPLRHAVP